MRERWQDEPRLDDLLALGAPPAGLEEAQALAGLERELFGRQPKPIRFARYVLLDRIGSGAAGVVFRAYDPELDRQVAVKLMHGGPDAGRREQARLLREAQALARVNHPNVVTVFDVGSYDERDWDAADAEGVGGALGGDPTRVPRRGVFMVMELVRGLDLARWLRRESPDAARILEVFVMAGRGLAAAHAAGLAHRDFKPSNVLLGDDGRVRVVDFGLVRRLDERGSPGEAPGASQDRSAPRGRGAPDMADSPASTAELQTVGVVGTPAYMAPEQHRGERAGALADQYAFAISLAEAMSGRRPFDPGRPSSSKSDAARSSGARWRARVSSRRAHGSSASQPSAGRSSLAEAKAAGPQGELVGLPPWLTPLLERALSPDPSARFDAIDELLDAIVQAQSRGPRRRRALAFALVGAAVVAVAVWGAQLSEARSCQVQATDAANEIWAARASDVAAVFRREGRADAARAFDRVDARMDTWAQRWRQARTELCERSARPEDRASTNAHIARARACLDRRVREADTLVGLWLRAQGDELGNAPLHAAELGRPEHCLQSDPSRTPSLGPAERRAVDAARLELAEARAMSLAGRQLAALDQVEAVAALELPDAALRSELALVRAGVAERRGEFELAESQLLEAIWAAESGHEDEIAAEAWLRLVWVVGVEQRRVEQGLRWAQFTEVALTRVGTDPLARATLEHNRAGLALVQGEHATALARYRRALGAQRDVLGEDHPVVARTLNHIANVLIEQRAYTEAASYAERSRQIRVRTLGPRHPLVASALSNRALAELRAGDLERGLETARAGLDITRGSSTPEERVAWHVYAEGLRRSGLETELVAARREAARLDQLHGRGSGE